MARLSMQLVLAACLLSFTASTPLERSSAAVSVTITKPKFSAQLAKDFVEKENARLGSFSSLAASSNLAPVTNTDVSYVAQVGVGSQTFNLIVDTGSSNTWVGAGKKFSQGSATNTRLPVSVNYGSGAFAGTEYLDTVSLGGLTATQQSIGVAATAKGFSGVDGIIGFGPTDLTQKTVSGLSQVPTFLDTLYSQKKISTEVLGVSFAPEPGSSVSTTNGELDLGGTDSSKYTGSISYVSRTKTAPYSYYWGVGINAITYGSTSLGTGINAIVDTGTTVIYIPQSAFQAFLTAAKGTVDSSSGLAVFSVKPTANVVFNVGGTSLTLTPSQYLIPQAQYQNFNGLQPSKFYSWIQNGGPSASSVNCILGQKFLENYYSVFDATNNRIGFAPRS